MENKYYIPEIEEFHIGFKYKIKDCLSWYKRSYEPDDDSLVGDVLSWIKKKEVKVKYLDKEDIESLGWEIKEDNTKLFVLDYEKQFTNCDRKIHNKVFIHYNLISKWALITTGNRKYTYKDENKLDKSITRFCGYIKNKSELIKLMKQLGI